MSRSSLLIVAVCHPVGLPLLYSAPCVHVAGVLVAVAVPDCLDCLDCLVVWIVWLLTWCEAGTAFTLSSQEPHPEDVWGTTKSANPAADIQIHFVPGLMPDDFFDKVAGRELPLRLYVCACVLFMELRRLILGIFVFASAQPH